MKMLLIGLFVFFVGGTAQAGGWDRTTAIYELTAAGGSHGDAGPRRGQQRRADRRARRAAMGSHGSTSYESTTTTTTTTTIQTSSSAACGSQGSTSYYQPAPAQEISPDAPPAQYCPSGVCNQVSQIQYAKLDTK
jgi:hypothetical protein